MTWIEMIQLRAVNRNRNLLESILNKLINEVGQNNRKHIVMVYSSALIDTDYSIHIIHDSNKVEKLGSPLGVLIVNALREFGLVNHSVWYEIHSK